MVYIWYYIMVCDRLDMGHHLFRDRNFLTGILTNVRRVMNKRLLNGLICILVLIGITVLYWFDPEDYMWMPKCPTKLLFNIDCPGCGFQRAIHAIIHGEFKRAFALNPFLFLAAPYAIIAFSYETIRNYKIKKRIECVVENRYMRYGYIALFFIWFVIRNIK